MARGGSALVTLVVTAAIASPAFAQAPAAAGDVEIGAAPVVADPVAARHWLAIAQGFARRGAGYAANHLPDQAKPQLEAAVAAYRKAIEAGADLNLYLELAGVEERLGRLDDAMRSLRRVVRAGTHVRPDVQRRATARLAALTAEVGIVALHVTPAGTAITLGGSELGSSPLPEPLVLRPGTYTLAFQADGFVAMEAEIKVEPGTEIERSIELVPVAPIVPPAPPPRPREVQAPPPPPPSSRLPLYLGAGATAVAAVGGSVFGILAISEHTAFTAPATSSAGRDDARTRGQRLALLADISIGTAVAAAGVTAYWYFYKYKRSPHPPDAEPQASVTTKLDVVPWVQPQSGGVTLAGRF